MDPGLGQAHLMIAACVERWQFQEAQASGNPSPRNAAIVTKLGLEFSTTYPVRFVKIPSYALFSKREAMALAAGPTRGLYNLDRHYKKHRLNTPTQCHDSGRL
jgi:hypothetical protein